MTKFVPPEQELEKNIELIKQRVKRKQKPRHNAPKVPADLLITLSGCNFRTHKQDGRMLVLKADEKSNFEKDINTLRSISYIAGVYDAVSVYGWDWRPVRYKKDKLYLRPIAPTLETN